MMMEEVKKRLVSFGIKLEVSTPVMERICEQGFDRSYDARPLRRALTLIIEDPLSESLLIGEFERGNTAVIDLDESGYPLSFAAALAVLNTEASQSRQHDMSEPDLTSHLSQSLLDVGSRRISIVTVMCERQVYWNSVLVRFMDDLMALDSIAHFGFSDRRPELSATFSISTNSE
ncbi:chaperone protein ClpD, chloroplastic [Tanacetum coccineum]